MNGSPVYVHGGPFANVSIGIPTLVSVEMACALHDVVIVEAGYGTDAGAQKWLDIACREYGAQWPSAAIVVTRASTWRDDPELAWRYPFHVQRLENLDIPTFPLINLWEGEDDQVPSLKATADELGFRTPIIGNLFRDGGEALAPQLDGFVDALQNGSMPAEPHSHKGMALTENITYDAKGWPMENSFMQYKIPARVDIGHIRVEFESSYEPNGPFGAKSIGEVVINTPLPAIADAIYNAIGTRFYELPITPEQVAMAVEENR